MSDDFDNEDSVNEVTDEVTATPADDEINAVDEAADQEAPLKLGDWQEESGDSNLYGMMQQNFIEYASYVIKDRAIPDIDDGLKPVQRRILHSLNRMDDGKFHKVANVIGHTMQFHPHGDASIGSALVNLANKDFFIDKQGNFGNPITGDAASAARYIECRLTPLAREVIYNRELTEFVDSYDGRNQEPVSFPAKVPALLMQGAEGIAVGMATKIMPHNFCELLQAQIDMINGRPFQVYPDFHQGGLMDASEYDDGNGKLKVRAKIEPSKSSTKTLVIREIPPTTTTESVIHSIEEAARKNKLKIASINDYTAEAVEIEVIFQRGVSMEKAELALYAYTECEVNISPNLVVIKDNHPVIMSVSEVLKYNTEKLVKDLRRELELELRKLEDLYHAKSLEQIFIENRIYKRIEECTSQEEIFQAVYAGLAPFTYLLRRPVEDPDIEKLLEIRIRRISRFDMEKSRREVADIVDKMNQTLHNLRNLKAYTINFIKSLLTRYGKDYPRRTVLMGLEQVNVKEVALSNVKVGYDRSSGLVGSAVKSDETLSCTEYDRLTIFSRKDGTVKVINIPDKDYIGQGMEVYKHDRDQIFCIIYKDKKSQAIYAKRCQVNKFLPDRDYQVTPKGSRIERIYTSDVAVVNCEYESATRTGETEIEINFAELQMRSLTARGFKITGRKVAKYILAEKIDPEELAAREAEEAAEDLPEEENNGLEDELYKVDNARLQALFTNAAEVYESVVIKVIDPINASAVTVSADAVEVSESATTHVATDESESEPDLPATEPVMAKNEEKGTESPQITSVSEKFLKDSELQTERKLDASVGEEASDDSSPVVNSPNEAIIAESSISAEITENDQTLEVSKEVLDQSVKLPISVKNSENEVGGETAADEQVTNHSVESQDKSVVSRGYSEASQPSLEERLESITKLAEEPTEKANSGANKDLASEDLILSADPVEVPKPKPKKRGGYREVPPEERNPRRFLIDEADDSFMLESD